MMERSFSTMVFIFVIVVSCSSAVFSLSINPRVTRTSDATIIDFAEDQNYGEMGQVGNPGEFTSRPWPAAEFDPYSMIYQQQQEKQPTFYYGWSYFYRQPMNLTSSSTSSSDAVPSSRQLDKHWRRKQSGKQAIRCGRGPATMPVAKRSLISQRIAAGADTKKNLWPFMVALKRGDDTLFCGGSLINSDKVLLAAQCLEQMSTFDISAVTVLIGMHKSDFSDVQMTRRISKIVFHSKYNAATFANDIAIITLDMPVPFSRTVSPVCLPPANDDPDQYADQDAIILGWGGTGVTVTGPVDVLSSSGTDTVSGPSTGTVGTISDSGITAVNLPGTVNGPGINSASGISVSGPGTTTGTVGGSETGTRPISGPVNGLGTGTLNEPISVGGSGANNRPSTAGTGANNRPSSTSGTGSTTTVSSGPEIETQTDSVIMPVTSVPVTASTVTAGTGTGTVSPVSGPVSGSSSYDGTVINIGGFSVISGKIDRPSRPSIKISRAISLAPPNPFLQQAKVAILSNSDCRADSVIGKFVSDKTICISSPDKFTCAGDVGGPIVFLSSPGTWTLVGINSYTQDCKTNGLKTRVSAFRAWIDLYMN